jgi:hypothetical protein
MGQPLSMPCTDCSYLYSKRANCFSNRSDGRQENPNRTSSATEKKTLSRQRLQEFITDTDLSPIRPTTVKGARKDMAAKLKMLDLAFKNSTRGGE